MARLPVPAPAGRQDRGDRLTPALASDAAIDRIIVSLAPGSGEGRDDFVFFELDEGVVSHLRRHVRRPHRHQYQQIMWLAAGSAEHLLDDEVVTVPARSLIVIPEGHTHRFVPAADARGCFICFNDEFLPRSSCILFNQFIAQATIPVPDTDIVDLETLLALIAREARRPATYDRSVLRHLVRALIARGEELHLRTARIAARELSASQAIWERFTILIEQSFKREHAVSHYAREIGISPRRLGAVVRLYTGQSTAAVIDSRIIREARRLLLFSDLSVKEIAFELGFDDHSYFSKVFRRIGGSSPSDYRQQHAPAQNYPK